MKKILLSIGLAIASIAPSRAQITVPVTTVSSVTEVVSTTTNTTPQILKGFYVDVQRQRIDIITVASTNRNAPVSVWEIGTNDFTAAEELTGINATNLPGLGAALMPYAKRGDFSKLAQFIQR